MALFLNDFLSHYYVLLAEPILLIALIARIWTFDAAITGSYKWTADICPRVFQTWSLAEHMRTWGRFDERVGRVERTTRADRTGIRWLDTSTAGNTSITSKIGRQNKAINVIEKCISVQEWVSFLKEGVCRICVASPQKEEKTIKIPLFHFSL